MTRTKVKVSKTKSGIYTALGLKESKTKELEILLLDLFAKHPQISSVCEELWNREDLSDQEVIICLIGIGRGQAQTEIKQQTENSLSDLMKMFRQ